MVETRVFPPVFGSFTLYNFSGATLSQRVVLTGQESLLVSGSGFGSSHPFEMERSRCTPPSQTGFRLTQPSQPSHGRDYHGYPNGSFRDKTIAYKPFMDSPNGEQMASRLLAGTNPSRPAIRLPVALFELKDLPMMYHQALTILTAGRRGSKKGRYWKRLSPTQRLASANLAVQFGFAPMIRDVVTLFGLPATFEKRQKEFDRLYSHSGLKRRLTLSSGQKELSTTFRGTEPTDIRPVKGVGQLTCWGTVRWKPTQQSPKFGRPTDKEVWRMLLGLTAGDIPANLWNALPWSWLIDWFSNAGDILQGIQGRADFLPSNICVMTHRTFNWTSEPHSLTTYAGARIETTNSTGGETLHESKKRTLPSGTTLSASIPYISGGQLSILGSLAVSRNGRKLVTGAPPWRPGSFR